MKSANQNLAENLTRLMRERKLSDSALGKAAKLSPNTIKNYSTYDAKHPPVTTKGKERSAKLTEVERLANALGVTLIDLIAEHETAAPIPMALSTAHQQLLFDLGDLPPPRQSKFIDQLHEAAEEARESAAYLVGKRKVSMAAGAPSWKSTAVLTFGDNNPQQGSLPLSPVADPFTAAPGAREAAWYGRIGKSPRKGRR